MNPYATFIRHVACLAAILIFPLAAPSYARAEALKIGVLDMKQVTDRSAASMFNGP